MDAETVFHGVKQVNAGKIQAGNLWADGHRPGGDHQPVVRQLVPPVRSIFNQDRLAFRGDGAGRVLEQQLDARAGKLIDGPVSEVAPVGHFAAHVEGQTADAKAGIVVGHHDGHPRVGVNLSRPQRRADAGITAADDQQAWHESPHEYGKGGWQLK